MTRDKKLKRWLILNINLSPWLQSVPYTTPTVASCKGFRNPKNECSWNLEYSSRNPEFFLLFESGIQYLESRTLGVESRIQDCLGFPCLWWQQRFRGTQRLFFFSTYCSRSKYTLKFLTFEKSYQFLDINMCFHNIFIPNIFKKSLCFTYKANGKHQIQVENFSR